MKMYLISDNVDTYTGMRLAGVEGCVVRRKDYASSEDFDAALLKTLKDHNIDLVVLAGFRSEEHTSELQSHA